VAETQGDVGNTSQYPRALEIFQVETNDSYKFTAYWICLLL